jgi:hypothetical protein
MRTIAIKLASYNITINRIVPWAIDMPIDADVMVDPQKMEAL